MGPMRPEMGHLRSDKNLLKPVKFSFSLLVTSETLQHSVVRSENESSRPDGGGGIHPLGLPLTEVLADGSVDPFDLKILIKG